MYGYILMHVLSVKKRTHVGSFGMVSLIKEDPRYPTHIKASGELHIYEIKNKDSDEEREYGAKIFFHTPIFDGDIIIDGTRKDWCLYCMTLEITDGAISIRIPREESFNPVVNFPDIPPFNEQPKNWFFNHWHCDWLIEKIINGEEGPIELDLYVNLEKYKEYLKEKESELEELNKCIQLNKERLNLLSTESK